MPRRSPRIAREPEAVRAQARIESAEVEEGEGARHLVVFEIAGGRFAFGLGEVGEIIRVPRLARMPLGPRSLLGLANLRGNVVPVVDLRRLLGLPDAPPTDATRVVVMEGGAPVGFAVDRMWDVRTVPGERIERDDAAAGAFDPDLLDGVVRAADGGDPIKILKPGRLLREEFGRLGFSAPRTSLPAPALVAEQVPATVQTAPRVSLVSFDLGQQEYALPLERVHEIIPEPDQVSDVARAETAVIGVVALRDRLLPLVSLRALLGLPARTEAGGKVLVLSMGAGAIGMVADGMREILHVDPALIDPAPALLTRGAGDAEITSICRLDGGRRLVALLSPDRMFRSDLVRRLLAEHEAAGEALQNQANGSTMAEAQFVIFQLGGQDYGVPIGAIEEIAQLPDRLTRLPKAPPFVEGVINLRGSVVPIIDLRRRFELGAKEPGGARRILVLTVGGGKTGFMVDSVSEVLRVQDEEIHPAPELSSEQLRLIGHVASIDSRMILLIDPGQLLDQVEADMLARFDPTRGEDPKPS